MGELEVVVEGEIVETYTYLECNNSGGSFWLSDEQWLALEKAGWIVEWGNRSYPKEGQTRSTMPRTFYDQANRYMGAAAVCAFRLGLPFADAIREFEQITGEDAAALGCKCCVPPYEFSERQIIDDKAIRWMNHDVTSTWSV